MIKKITVKEIRKRIIYPNTNGALAIERANKINKNIENFCSYVNVGDIIEIQSHANGADNAYCLENLGIHNISGGIGTIPQCAVVIITKDGIIEFDINYRNACNWTITEGTV